MPTEVKESEVGVAGMSGVNVYLVPEVIAAVLVLFAAT
jgi:hypothetical protein